MTDIFDYDFGIGILFVGAITILGTLIFIIAKPAAFFMREDFRLKFGSLFEGLNLKAMNKGFLLYNVNLLFRRIAYAVICVYLQDY